ncbi:transferase family protein [Stachybotrys elegans]|uniref:Transferase family protein n=1 Tax=Stachybotrys elegans TaxID=80388 RepID=A0A8K0SBV1_9HYPO|nr:transferase family protein [Stachybotrys elegans]
MSHDQAMSKSPAGLHTIPLSLLDSTTANFANTNAVWAFEQPAKLDSFDKVIQHLRKCLCLVLEAYPPWCGTLKAATGTADEGTRAFPPHCQRYGRLYAVYGTDDDTGVEFTAAKSTATLADIHPSYRQAEQPQWNRRDGLDCFLSPSRLGNPLRTGNKEDDGVCESLMAIMITQLACQGVVISAKMAHPLGDITTLVAFMKDWAQISRAELGMSDLHRIPRLFNPLRLDSLATGDIDSQRPDDKIVTLAHSLPMHRYDWWHSSRPDAFKDRDISPMGTAMPWAEWNTQQQLSHYTIHLNKQQVDYLWRQANVTSETPISRHDAILGHTWSCISRARQLQDDKPVHCDLVYGLRPALGLGEMFLGSPIIMLNIELPSDVVSDSQCAAPVARKIRSTLVQMSSEDNIKAHLHALAFEMSPQRIWQAFLGSRHILATSWARAGLYEVDFGLGGRLRFADGVISGVDGLVLIKEAPPQAVDASSSGSWTEYGVDVTMHICEDDMERLLNDPILLPQV